MKKLLLSIVMLALAMFCGAQSPCWDGTVADAYAGGDGTPENPYQIANAAQLALLAEQTNNGIGGDACYILTDDICLNENVGSDSHNWTPIGYMVNNHDYRTFTGVFDGGGHVIDNLYSSSSEYTIYKGLFGYAENATIKNIIITNASLTGAPYIGIIAGCAVDTYISNCMVYGAVQAVAAVGGIVGYCKISQDHKSVTIDYCVNHSNVISGIIGSGGIVGYSYGNLICKKCENYGVINGESDSGGIIGFSGPRAFFNSLINCVVEECVNHEDANITGCTAGGIVGRSNLCIINRCVNHALITGQISGDTVFGGAFVGGITGTGGVISNCYNRGDLTAIKTGVMEFDEVYIGGIVGIDESEHESHSFNVYNTGNIIPPVGPSIQEYGYGNIVGYSFHPDDNYYNCYWLEDDEFPACGNEEMQEHPDLPCSTSFVPGATPTSWILNEAQYGTTDLLEALNAGSLGQCTWLEDVTGVNDGYPVFDMAGEPDYQLVGNEWYYKIINADGDIHYQHLLYASDTTINNKKVKIIVKTNTLYDLRFEEATTHEYIYEENNCVYWWNKTLQEFTVLYDFGANTGDEWDISVGEDRITMHVDDVCYYVKDARWFKAMTVSDDNDIFSGTILCGIGHLTSFFPEKLMNHDKDFEVDGLRCYWKDDVLLLKEGDVDCDYIYENNHFGIDEKETSAFTVYPNPATDIVTIHLSPEQTRFIASQLELMDIHGQLMEIRVQNNQIDVSNLPNGIYFIKIGNDIVKLIINR